MFGGDWPVCRVAGDSLAARGLLRNGLDPAEATDVLLTLAGSAVFLDFTEVRGWTTERYVSWTTDTLCVLLVQPRTRNLNPDADPDVNGGPPP
jgi:hypothetical protein